MGLLMWGLTCEEGLAMHASSSFSGFADLIHHCKLLCIQSVSLSVSSPKMLTLFYSFSICSRFFEISCHFTTLHLWKSFIQASGVRWTLNYFFLIKFQGLLNVYQ